MSLSKFLSEIRHRRFVNICEATLKSRSTVAELGKVELHFLKDSATAGCCVNISTVVKKLN